MAAWLQLFKSLDWTSPSSISRCSANGEQRETGSTGLDEAKPAVLVGTAGQRSRSEAYRAAA
jgi:hypothetical protein